MKRLLVLALFAAPLAAAAPASAEPTAPATRICGPLPGGSWCYDTATGDLDCNFVVAGTSWKCA